MARPSRARRILKWTGVGVSVLIVLVWIVCQWYWLLFEGTTGYLAINSDCIRLENYNTPGVRQASVSAGRCYRLTQWIGLPILVAGPKRFMVELPYWLLMLLTAIPTAWLWHRGRRRIRPGLCPRCGYDLTGNTSGICSECGERLPSAAASNARGSIEANG